MDAPEYVDTLVPNINEKEIKKMYRRKDRKALLEELNQLDEQELTNMEAKLRQSG